MKILLVSKIKETKINFINNIFSLFKFLIVLLSRYYFHKNLTIFLKLVYI